MLAEMSAEKMKDSPHYDPWLTVKMAADYCSYHPDTIREAIHLKALRARKEGRGRGQWRIQLSKLNRWMASRENASRVS